MIESPNRWYYLVAIGVVGFGAAKLGHIEYVDEETGSLSFFEKIGVLPPNAIGDTFAGIFGSLAFLAAVFAIVLQGNQLAAQKEELRLTREEVKGQREAAESMARAMQAQAKVFEDEQRFRAEKRAKDILEELLYALDRQLFRCAKSTWTVLGKKRKRDSTRFIRSDGGVSFPLVEVDAKYKFRLLSYDPKIEHGPNLVKQSEMCQQQLNKLMEFAKGSVLERPDRDCFERFSLIIKEIESIHDDLAEDQRIRVQSLGLFHLLGVIDSALGSDLW